MSFKRTSTKTSYRTGREIEDLEDNRGNLIGPGDPRVARS